MNNILIALDSTIALTRLLLEITKARDEGNALIMQARSEGRDVSDEELAVLKMKTDRLYNEWNSL